MAKKKKRTKQKKKSSTQTKEQRQKKKSETKVEKKETKATKEEEQQDEAEEKVEEEQQEESAAKQEDKESEKETTDKKTKKREKKSEDKASKKQAKALDAVLKQANTEFSAGNYQSARKQLIEVLEKQPSPEQSEQAQALLGNMEMDVRTLMVGAVATVTLLLIPTLGPANFSKALWTIPVLFLLLIVDPRLFRSPTNAATDEK